MKDAPLAEALETVCQKTPPKPSTLNPDIGPDLDAIVMTALAKDPDERYRAAAALAEDVERYLDGRPVRAVAPTFWYVTKRFLRRNAAIATIVGVSAMTLTAATVVSVRMAQEARAQAARSQAAQQILSDVFKKSNPFKGKGATVSLADALVRAQPDIEARVAGDPLLAWEVNRTLGKIYERLGLIEQEVEAYEAVIEAARALGDDENGARVLAGVAGVGNVLARTNPVEAVRYFDANLPAQPASARAVALWLSAQYSYVGALARVQEFGRADAGTFAMAKAMDTFGITDPHKRGRLSQLLAGAARRAKDTEAEDRHWRDAVEYMRATNVPSTLAITLSNRAIFLGRAGRYAESEAAFKEALGIFEAAGFKDPTYGSVLRGYAGTLFRTGRIDEAIATTRKALSLLPADSQPYARFVAALHLTGFTFVKGDMMATVDLLAENLASARTAFADRPAVPQRFLRLFAKTLVFGRAFESASAALGYDDGVCTTEAELLTALETLEHPREASARTSIWQGLAKLEDKAQANEITADDLAAFLQLYDRTAPPFFDVLDHWRVLDRLAALPAPLPPAAKRRYEALLAQREQTQGLVRQAHAATLADLSAYLHSTSTPPEVCP